GPATTNSSLPTFRAQALGSSRSTSVIASAGSAKSSATMMRGSGEFTWIPSQRPLLPIPSIAPQSAQSTQTEYLQSRTLPHLPATEPPAFQHVRLPSVFSYYLCDLCVLCGARSCASYITIRGLRTPR